MAQVWQAITDPDQMRQWFFAAIDAFAPERGFATRFNVRSGDRDYPHLWRVTEAVPPTKDWSTTGSTKGSPGNPSWFGSLAAIDDGTKLTLTHTGIETFPQDDGAAFHRGKLRSRMAPLLVRSAQGIRRIGLRALNAASRLTLLVGAGAFNNELEPCLLATFSSARRKSADL